MNALKIHEGKCLKIPVNAVIFENNSFSLILNYDLNNRLISKSEIRKDIDLLTKYFHLISDKTRSV